MKGMVSIGRYILKLSFRFLAAAFATLAVTGGSLDPSPAAAQDTRVVVIGRVVDEATMAPLQDVHVFIAESMIGTVTRSDGTFTLDQIPAGGHSIYVSRLGYEPQRLDTLLQAGQTYEFSFGLRPTVLEGPEIIVRAERSRAWKRRLAKFERLFIGESEFADECELLNPEVLSFEATWTGRLTAEAAAPLEIENRALGYLVTYFLRNFEAVGGRIRFDGEPLFEELIPADSLEAVRWQRNRRRAFLGSFRHFMQTLLTDRLREEGYRVYRRFGLNAGTVDDERFGFDPDRVLRNGSAADTRVLDFYGYIEAVYLREEASNAYLRWQYGTTWGHPATQRSFVKLTDGPTQVDDLGEVLDPYGVTLYGHFAFERLAEMVPKEYAIPQL